MKECEKYKNLLMGLMDNELTSEEASEVNTHLLRCSKCREEYEQLRKTGTKIEAISFVEPQDEVLKRLWKSPYSRFVRNSGILLVLGGWIGLIFYGIYEFLRSGKEPVFPKIATVAVFVGFIILLVSVIRERVTTYQSDPYKEVKR